MRGLIYNLGSLNRDRVYRVPTVARGGETLRSTGYAEHAGGKGLNQSVAIGRAGGRVRHLGAVGEDGRALLETLQAEGVDVSDVKQLDGPSGHAVIQVDDAGENAILVEPGANGKLLPWEIEQALERLQRDDIVLMQNETNCLEEAIREGSDAGATVVLSPAPMTPDVLELPLHRVSLIVLNETEAQAMVGQTVAGTRAAAEVAQQTGGAVLLTLGERGAVYREPNGSAIEVSAPAVKAVDTTAAGDGLLGYFLASRQQGLSVEASLERAVRAASMTVTRAGASPSIPHAQEVDAALAAFSPATDSR